MRTVHFLANLHSTMIRLIEKGRIETIGDFTRFTFHND